MKFILSIFLYAIMISPVLATVTTQCPQQNANWEQTCSNQPGCYWIPGDEYSDPQCELCPGGFACLNGTKTQCDTYNWPTGITTTNAKHPDGASSCSDWVCNTGYTQFGTTCQQCTGVIPQNSSYPTNATGCDDWICDAGYYKGEDSGESVCVACPNNTSSVPGMTDVSQCNLCTTAGQVLLYDNNNEPYCDTCAEPTYYDQSQHACVCPQNANNSNGCTCGTNAHLDPSTNECVCDSGFEGQSHDGNVLNCSDCPPPNQEKVNGECKCASGFYGNGGRNGTCTACPDDSSSPAGSTTISACTCDDSNKKMIKIDNNNYQCMEKPAHSTYDSASYIFFCSNNAVATYNPNGIVTACNCPSDAVFENDNDGALCTCNFGFYQSSADPFVCSRCGVGMTTTTRGATAKNACQMTSNTKFCDSKGNCMKLIPPSGVTIQPYSGASDFF